MSKWVFRTDIRQRQVGSALHCVDASELFFRPEERTVNESVQMLLEADEICLGTSDKRSVMQGPKVVGYIQVTDCV
jgi:hypothetical protein